MAYVVTLALFFGLSLPLAQQGGATQSTHSGPASAPGRGATPGPQATGDTYTCSMHPEVVRSEPGKCPICGMTLVPTPRIAPERQHPGGD